MSTVSKISLKNAVRLLSGAAVIAAAIAVAPAANAAGHGGSGSVGGGYSNSDGEWQQIFDRNQAAFPNANARPVYRPIENPQTLPGRSPYTSR
jgi:opacity protein-like surface antigen